MNFPTLSLPIMPFGGILATVGLVDPGAIQAAEKATAFLRKGGVSVPLERRAIWAYSYSDGTNGVMFVFVTETGDPQVAMIVHPDGEGKYLYEFGRMNGAEAGAGTIVAVEGAIRGSQNMASSWPGYWWTKA